MIGNATQRIKENIRDEFAAIRSDVQRHLGPDVTVDHARTLLLNHVPALVVGRSQILLDSLLNYLMEDAVISLADAPIDAKNAFYAQDFRTRIKDTFSINAQTLRLSFDQRLIYGGAAAGSVLLASGVVLFFVSNVVPPVLIGLGAIVTSAVVFRVAYSAGSEPARRALTSDVDVYLERSEVQMGEWLGEVARTFDAAIDMYASQCGIQRGSVA